MPAHQFFIPSLVDLCNAAIFIHAGKQNIDFMCYIDKQLPICATGNIRYCSLQCRNSNRLMPTVLKDMFYRVSSLPLPKKLLGK